MTNYISENFGHLGISISDKKIHDVEKLSIIFPLRNTHPLTFDGPNIACDPVAWTTSDYNALFDVFQIHKSDVEKAIRACPSIDRNFNVISDPYNLLTFWLVHLAFVYIKDTHVRREFQMSLLKLFHYKVFCSVVNNSFKHGAKRDVVLAAIESLTKKSDIIRYGSWKLLIEAHCEKILDTHDRFYQTLVNIPDDESFLRVVSENQTAIRSKIVSVARVIFTAHAEGDGIGSRSSTAENDDGEKILTQMSSVIESATASVISEVLNPNMFINEISVEDISRQFTTISPRMLKTALLKINETAVIQTSTKSFDKVEQTKEGPLYIGVRSIISEIIKSITRTCRMKRVNMGNKAQVYETMRDAYRSSRNADTDILAIKRSVAHLVDPFNITSNVASQATLRLGVIYYIIYRTIQKLKV